MIELTVSKTSDSPSVFSLSPKNIDLGGKQASGVDFLRVSVPPDWQGKTVRITFVHTTNSQKVSVILPETGIVKLTSDITSCSGDIVIDAAGTDNYAAYSMGCHYTVYNHPDTGSNGQVITPDEYHQFVGEVKNYSDLAKSSADKAMAYTTTFQNSGYHNSIYRGKDISSNEADGSMYTNIASGTFDDIFVGDYFNKTVNGQNYVFQVLGCDIKMNRGSTPLTAHHIVVMPTTSFGSYKMNDTNTTDGGYVGSKMYTDVLPVWAGYLSNAFGSHLITSKELLVNATSSGSPSGWSWFDSTVNLMTVEEILGHGTFGISHYEYYFNIGISYGQLPLFRLSPDKICIRYATYWLRNIPQSTYFSTVNNEGYVHITPASASAELRPYFLLG
ncbi:MAG: hypothetical protein LKJ50_05545 [Clostridiales bacterium]|jgi:hypothetical protein|nr:hypothetical protein [Clostridiales bacterium]MCI1961748.1 hypothetical protein [Clostridiales bacterium]MCI2021843.1 hypothetical protein [Clostridiales bacterium]MCI2026142.1 hypothetical protein [Clostridiales bacterium]